MKIIVKRKNGFIENPFFLQNRSKTYRAFSKTLLLRNISFDILAEDEGHKVIAHKNNTLIATKGGAKSV